MRAMIDQFERCLAATPYGRQRQREETHAPSGRTTYREGVPFPHCGHGTPLSVSGTTWGCVCFLPLTLASVGRRGQTTLELVYHKDDVLDSGFLEKVKTKRWLLLSNLSQSSVLTPKFPPNLKEVRLTQVVRSTKGVVAGAAAFHATPNDKEGLGSLCPGGPPIKTFLFQTIHVAGAEKDYVTYVQKSVAAIHFIVDGYRGLSLHHRVALLVCHDDFRQKFEPVLKEALNIGKRKFDFTSFQDSDVHVAIGVVRSRRIERQRPWWSYHFGHSGECERTGTAVRDLHRLGFWDQLLAEWCHHQSEGYIKLSQEHNFKRW